jgi:hypothetical protein
MKFDTFLATVDDWGKFQKVKYTLICLTYMLPSIMVYTYTFTAAVPNHRCINPVSIDTDVYSEASNKLFDSTYKPTEDQCKNEVKQLSLTECQRCFIRLQNRNQSLQNRQLKKCHDYVYDRQFYKKTLVEEVRSREK